MGRLAFVLGLFSFWLTACNSDVDFAGPNNQTEDALAGPQSLIHEFPAGSVSEVTVSLKPDRQSATQALSLRSHPRATKTGRQINRTQHQDEFTQGHDGASAGPENFQLTSAGLLDLLVVVDYSTSMLDEQAKLAAGFASLISKIDSTDWRIAVAAMGADSIDLVDGCLRMNRVIKKSDADRDAAFQAAVNIPLSPTNKEYGFPTAIKALKGECMGQTVPWLRAGSTVGVLILSDEDNCGSAPTEGCPGAQGQTAQQMADFLASIRPGGQGRVYGLFEQTTECVNASSGTIYGQAVALTQGTAGSICAATYDAALSAISNDVNRIVKREFMLEHAPDPTTLQLVIDGVPVSTGFTVNGKKITFGTVAETALLLSASYVYGATPKTSTYTLTNDADPATLKVKVGAAMVDASGYTYDEVTKDLTFVDEPADDAKIVFRYRQGDELPAKIALGINDMLGSPEIVKLSGKEVAAGAYTFDATDGSIEFPDPPGDGAEVSVTYTTTGPAVTAYPAAIEAGAEVLEVKATDKATGDEVPVTLVGDKVVFAETEIVEGRSIDLFYQLGYDPAAMAITLASEVAGTVTVQASGDNPAACVGTLEGKVVHVDCGGIEVDQVDVSYQAVDERFHQFTIPEEVPAGSTWHVYVDGTEVTGFTVEGATVTVDETLLKATSTVKVVVDLPKVD